MAWMPADGSNISVFNGNNSGFRRGGYPFCKYGCPGQSSPHYSENRGSAQKNRYDKPQGEILDQHGVEQSQKKEKAQWSQNQHPAKEHARSRCDNQFFRDVLSLVHQTSPFSLIRLAQGLPVLFFVKAIDGEQKFKSFANRNSGDSKLSCWGVAEANSRPIRTTAKRFGIRCISGRSFEPALDGGWEVAESPLWDRSHRSVGNRPLRMRSAAARQIAAWEPGCVARWSPQTLL